MVVVFASETFILHVKLSVHLCVCMVLFLYLARYMEHPDVRCGTTSLALGSILCSLFITNSLTLLLSLSKIWTSEGRFTLTLVILDSSVPSTL